MKTTRESLDSRILKWSGAALAAFLVFAFVSDRRPEAHAQTVTHAQLRSGHHGHHHDHNHGAAVTVSPRT